MATERIVVVGAGFAGLECVKRLEKQLRAEIDRGEVEVVVVSPNDYMLYLPLLPQVAAGVITAQSVTVPLPRAIKRAHRLPGTVVGVDLENSSCVVRKISGDVVDLPYDRLVLAPGSVTRKFDIPGLDEHALGMKNLAEAAYLRDHVISQLELAQRLHRRRRAHRALPVRGGRRRLRGHRDRGLPAAAHRVGAQALPPAGPGPGALDAGRHRAAADARAGAAPG